MKCAIDTPWGQKTLLRVILIVGISVFSGITLESAEPTSHDLGFAVVTQEIRLERDGGVLVVQMQSPPAERLNPRPMLLLNLSGSRRDSLADGRYGVPARKFLMEGHCVASFDLPAHGDRIDRHGSGISGLCARVIAGEDPFAVFIAEARAFVDESVRRGWPGSDQIVVCGVSRAGYCALRLAADDPRVKAVAAFAPVTDWRELLEFAAVKDRREVESLKLGRFVQGLAGRRVYVAIGNSDSRVGTSACVRFILELSEEEQRRKLLSQMRFHLADDSVGHGLADHWRQKGVEFLLQSPAGGATADPLP